MRVAVVSEGGEVVERSSCPTPRSGNSYAVADKVIECINVINSNFKNEVKGLGVGTIGPLDIKRGRVINTPNNPIRNFELLEPLRKTFNLPIYVVNDCSAAVWGEYVWGAGVGHLNVLYITLSTGVGGGAVVDGHLLLGKDGNAHEVGHVVLNYRSPIRCGCGGRGHWEGMASGANLWKLVRQVSRATGFNISDRELAALKPEDVFNGWREGRSPYSEVVNELAMINAAGLASAINVYDPEVVTVGGSIALNNPDFIKLMIGNLDEFLTNRMPYISLATFRDDAVLVGAAAIVHRPPKHLLRIQKTASNISSFSS